MVGKFNFKLFGINLAIYSIRDIDIHNSYNPPLYVLRGVRCINRRAAVTVRA